MNNIFLICALALVSLALCESPLKIYVFNVGQADSQLWIFPSNYTILIDLGEVSSNSHRNADYVAERLKQLLPTPNVIDMFVLTHHHQDHIGEAYTGGIWYLLEKTGISVKKILDRNAATWQDLDGNGVCNGTTEIVWKYAGTTSPTATKWICYSQDPKNSKVFPQRITSQLCSTTLVKVPDKGVTITIVTTDADGAKSKDGKDLKGDWTKNSNAPSENDYSTGLYLQYKNFSYITMGDLDGEYTEPNLGYYYDDVESVVAQRVPGVDVYHVDHHGSAHSSNQNFINKLSPSVSLISCGLNNEYGHPDQKVVDRIHSFGDIFLTNKGTSNGNYYNSVIAQGDLLLTTDGNSNVAITAVPTQETRTYKLKGARSLSCKK